MKNFLKLAVVAFLSIGVHAEGFKLVVDVDIVAPSEEKFEQLNKIDIESGNESESFREFVSSIIRSLETVVDLLDDERGEADFNFNVNCFALEVEEANPKSLSGKLKDAVVKKVDDFWSNELDDDQYAYTNMTLQYFHCVKSGDMLNLLIRIPTNVSVSELQAFLAEVVDLREERDGFVLQKVYTDKNWEELPQRVTDEMFSHLSPDEKRSHWGVFEVIRFSEEINF